MIDALYETLLLFRGRPVLLGPHLTRMLASAEMLGFARLGRERIVERVASEGAVRDVESMMRIVVTRDSNLEVMVAPLPERVRLRRDRGAVLLLDPSWQRDMPRHKSWPNDINERALAHAAAHECDEAIFVTSDGRLLEGTSTNLFLSRGGRNFATPRTGAILPGVMREWVLQHAASLGISVVEDDIDASEIGSGGFLTSSLTLFASIGSVAGAPVPHDRELAVSLRERFLRAVTGL